MRRFMRLVALAFAGWLAVGCGGAYADAISRGDKFAEAGMWDEAAAAYEEAMRIDPADPEGTVKLQQARRAQSADRLERAKALEQRGEVVAALELVQQAVKLDPASTEAQRAMARVNDAALDRAEQLSSEAKDREAFELTALVLKGSPRHARARELDEKLRTVLAEQAFVQSKEFVTKDKLGNALVELAACLVYRPDYPDAKLQFGQVKLKLEEQLRYHVLVERFAGAGGNAALSQGFKPELLAQSLDERLLLRVTKDKPAAEAHGVAVRGTFDGYKFNKDKSTIQRSCDYQCGTDSKPNPRRAELQNELAARERELSTIDDDVARAQKELLTEEQDAANIQKEVDRKQQDVDRARADLDRCRASAQPGNSSACSSEDSRMRSAQSSLDSERNRLSSQQSQVQQARDRVASANDRRESTRRSRDSANQELLREPEMITVPRYCPFNYAVEVHTVASEVTLKLTVDRLDGDKPIVADQPFRYDSGHKDETFPAHPGRCAEVSGGDALTLPTEEQVRAELVGKVIKDVRTRILASYDAYRQRFLAEARRNEAGGLGEEATESYVRYVLTGPHALDKRDQIAAFFAKSRGLSKLDALWTM